MSKKILVIIFLTIGANSFLTAQQVELGFIGGINSSKLRSDDLEFDQGFGFNAGISALYEIDENIRLRSGLIYKKKESTWNTGLISIDEFGNITSIEPVSTEFNFGYLSLPILIDYRLTPTFGVSFGPNIDFNLSDEFIFRGNEVDLGAETNAIDIGLNLGTYYSISNFEISISYNMNFLNVLEEQFNQNTFDKEKFSAIELNLYYYLKNFP